MDSLEYQFFLLSWFFSKVVLEIVEELILLMTISILWDQSSDDEVDDVCILGGVAQDGKEMLIGE